VPAKGAAQYTWCAQGTDMNVERYQDFLDHCELSEMGEIIETDGLGR
jgi:hypothetical protein